jgi:hypothetical protein
MAEAQAMVAVLICSIVNLGLIVGLLAGIAMAFVQSRVAIAAALHHDPLPSGLRPAAVAALPGPA